MMLGRLERLNAELVADVCARHGISPSELRVLSRLRYAQTDELRPGDIGRWVLQTTGGLTATLRRLEAGGRIERTPDPADGRGRIISLTDAGADFHDLVIAELSDRYDLALRGLELGAIRDEILPLIEAFERFGGHPRSGDWAQAQTETR